MTASAWEKLMDDVFLFRDSCNIYAVRSPEGTVMINAGTGLVTKHLSEVVSNKPLTLLLTHHFRDHTDGAIRLKAAGAEVLGPYWEQEYLLDPEQHFRERQTWYSYDNRWDRFSPIRPLPVDRWMMDYETRTIAGLNWEVLPTPSVTNGASSYIVTIHGQRLAFTGELVYDHGRTSRLAPLQYNYNDMSGAVNLWHSCTRLLRANVDRLFPSLGNPIENPCKAVEALKINLKRMEEILPGLSPQLIDHDEDDLEEVMPHLYRSKYGWAYTYFVLSKSGKVLSLDYGYNNAASIHPIKPHLSNRRPFLHGVKALKKRFGIDRIHTALISHFHDDHINGIPMLQRLYGTEVWAAKIFSDILERPERYDRPCLWHEPIKIHRHLPCGERFYWEEIPITLHPMSGHTRFASMICMEIDGVRVVHTGDQIFFHEKNAMTEFGPGTQLFTNHVYKNGLDIGCYQETFKHLKQFRPQLVLSGHTMPYKTNEQWYEQIEKGAKAFDEIHELLMPLAENDIHFGAESQGGKLKPYRVHQQNSGKIDFEGWVLNPFPTKQNAMIRLIAPDYWESDPLELELNPREQKEFRISLMPPPNNHCRRQPIGLDLTVGDRPFGQVAEALVTIGFLRF